MLILEEICKMNKPQSLPTFLNLHKKHHGICFLTASLNVASENKDLLLFPGQTPFPLVADHYHVNLCCIERGIRTVIDQCWQEDCRQALQALTPYLLNQKLTVCEFPEILYWYLLHD